MATYGFTTVEHTFSRNIEKRKSLLLDSFFWVYVGHWGSLFWIFCFLSDFLGAEKPGKTQTGIPVIEFVAPGPEALGPDPPIFKDILKYRMAQGPDSWILDSGFWNWIHSGF